MQLSIEHVTKKFGEKTAVDDISVELNEGVYGILGANGSGKTTLMRMLASVSRPTSGSIKLDGEEIFELDHEYRDLIGYLPQHVGYYKTFSAEKFLLYIAALKGLEKDVAKKKVAELLTLVGLEENRKGKIGKFSGGMKRRVGIAQALLNDPKILIVDEPTAGLDPKERIRFRNLLSQIATDRIVLLSTHIVSDIEFIAKEVLIMKAGRVVQKETPQALLGGIQDKVWSVSAAETEIPHFQSLYKVGNISRDEDQFRLRILSDSQPHPNAKNERPNLEDLYLYYFDEEAAG
ncbi:MAG TPA: ABC transporter ATP-binding protein [Bacillales bacterium]|nr:ABC transporter ATP-binding protein [Bacillales bacterium]